MAYRAMPEREPRRQQGRTPPPAETGGNPEQEPRDYVHAAYFANEHIAGHAYNQAQEAIYTGPPNDVSAYRLILEERWHVAVLGEPPPEDLDQKLQAILDQGVPATLPEDIVDYLKQRRAEAMKRGQWVEGHYRPGLRPQIPRKRKGK